MQKFNDNEHNYKFSIATLCRMLLNNDYTTKNIVYEPKARNTPSNIRERKEYCLEAAAWDRNDLVFIDEFGVNVFYCRKRGRSKKGQIAVRVREAKSNSSNISVVAAISPTRGLLLYDVHLETVTARKYVPVYIYTSTHA